MARDFVAASLQYFTRETAVVNAMPMTMACWFQVKDLTTDYILMSVGNNGVNGQWSLQFAGVTANDPVRAVHINDAGTAGVAAVNTSFSANTWHHAIAVFTATNSRKSYIDGVASSTNTTGVSSPTVDFSSIGAARNSTVSGYLDGKIAYPAFWNAALDADDASALAAGFAPWMVRPQNLASNPRFLARATDEEDWVAGGVWTNTNASTATADPRLILPPARKIFLPASAAQTIAVPLGTLALVGFAPTVTATAHQTIAVPLGTIALAGLAPVVTATEHQTIAVPLGALALAAFAPTVSATANNTVAVPLGTLALAGFAPTVSSSANQTVDVPLGTLALVGNAPTVSATENQTVAVPLGSLALAGFAPTVSSSADQTIAVPLGTLNLVGNAPTVSNSANNTIEVPAGAVMLTGFAPTVVSGSTVIVPLATLGLTGFAPTVTASANQTIDVPFGALTLVSSAPTVSVSGNQTISPPAGVLTLVGNAPTVTNGTEAPANTGGGRTFEIDGKRSVGISGNRTLKVPRAA